MSTNNSTILEFFTKSPDQPFEFVIVTDINIKEHPIFTIWGSKRIVMDGKKDTVYLGEDAYKCNNDLSVLTTLVEKINQEKINDRLRALGSSMDQGRF